MNRRRVIIVGTAMLLLVAVSTAAIVIHRKSDDHMEIRTEFHDDADRMGIDYGGNFDEFNYNPEDDLESEEAEGGDIEEEYDSEYYMNKTPEEIIAERNAKRGKGGFIGRDDSLTKTDRSKSNFSESEDNTWDDDFIDDDYEDAGEGTDTLELGIATIESKGYAQDEVLCNVDSEEEAGRVAAQISGTLLSWEYGIATIKIEGSVDELLDKLEQQGSNLNLYRHFYY